MKALKSLKTIALFCLPVILFSCSQSNDWPGWRGENRDAKVIGFKAPEKWPAQLMNVWQEQVGLGDGGPAVVNNKMYLQVKQESNEVAICLNALTGEQIWKTVQNPAPEVTGGARNHPGPRS